MDSLKSQDPTSAGRQDMTVADGKNLPETLAMSPADLKFLDKAVRAMDFEGARDLCESIDGVGARKCG